MIYFMPSRPKRELPDLISNDGKTIGERISKIRKEKELTQLELSTKIGIKRALLSEYETGRTRIFGDMIIRIAIALEVTPNQLMGFEKESPDS